MKCKHCIEKEKEWGKDNSEIQCAFESWTFSDHNWNCGTMDFLRDYVENDYMRNNDQYAGVFPYETDSEEWFLYLEWYKSRWETDKCYDMKRIEPLTLELAYNIIESLNIN